MARSGSIRLRDFGRRWCAPLSASGRSTHNGAQRRSDGIDRTIPPDAKPVPPGKPAGVVVAQPCLAVRILPRQRFQRKIDANCLVGLHQQRAPLRASEYQEFRGEQRQADFLVSCRVIDARN